MAGRLRGVAAVLALAVGGCLAPSASRAPAYYLLSPVPLGEAAGEPGGGAQVAGAPAVGVGPISLPGHLDRPQIVTRAADHRIEVDADAHWAEPLDSLTARILAENLSRLLATERVHTYPWSRTIRVDVQVEVAFAAFERWADGEVVLEARWRLVGSDGRERLAPRRALLRESGAGGPADVADGMSRALAALSRDIASAIREIR